MGEFYGLSEEQMDSKIEQFISETPSPPTKREGMFNSYCFTIRPLKGIKDSTIDGIVKWLGKQDYGFVCSEMDGEAKHLHGQIWVKEPRDKGTINKSLENICARTIEDWNPAQNLVMRRGTKVAYNNGFIEEYLSKEDNIIFNNPPNNAHEYYPSKEEQERVQKKAKSSNPQFFIHKENFLKNRTICSKITLEEIAMWVSEGMYKNDTIAIIQDDKRRKQFTKSLYYYIIGKANLRAMLSEDDYLKTSQHYNQMLMEQENR